jgi:hypothetical protein
MNQAPPRTEDVQAMSEGIVGELIGRPGIDMMLVDDLALQNHDSTDRLSLGSISGNFAYVDWRNPDVAVELLHACGIAGYRSRHATDPLGHAPRSGSRRIYCFDLRQFSSPREACAALLALQSSLEIKTFSLALPTTKSETTSVPFVHSRATDPQIPGTTMKSDVVPIAGGGETTQAVRNCWPNRVSEESLDDWVSQLNDDEHL